MIDTSQNMLYHIGNLNAESERISYQMASGKIIEKGSEDSMLYASIINLEDKLRVTEGLSLQIQKTQALNNTSDTNMSEVKVSLDTIKVDLLKGLNDGMDRSDKLALASNLEGVRGNLIDRVNIQVDGEYLFAGSVPTKQTLVKDEHFDVNGKIEFGGDDFLRKIAVEPGSYRDRGVTAYSVSFYNGSTANANEEFSFQDGERIIDDRGYEWKVLDENGDIYDINNSAVTATSLQRYDHNGLIVDTAIFPDSNIAIDSTTSQTESTATSQAVRGTYTISQLPATPEGRQFEAKHNYFDDLNVIINALEGYVTKLDGTRGSITSDEVVRGSLNKGLDQTTRQFDATNIGQGELGGRNNIFNVAEEKLIAQETHYNILIQDWGSADLAKLAMESKSLELTYQALYSTIAKMNELSLVNFLK